MTLAEKTYLTGRIEAEFQPIVETLEDQLIPIKERFREKLFKSLGLEAVDKKIRKLVNELETLNRQFTEVSGAECVNINFQSRPTGNGSGWANGQSVDLNKTPFGRAVHAKVIASKEAKSLVQAEAHLKALSDTVMLAGFPGELTELFTVQLPEATGKFRRLAGLPDTPKQLANGQ
jgi:hypothetical protein